MKRLYAIRGASCAENTKESITEATRQLCSKLFEENGIKTEDLVSLQFSLTKDLDVLNPCAALRKCSLSVDSSKVPLFCCQEAYIKGGLEKVIRLLVTVYLEEGMSPKHIYINGAEVLRPDINK